jgi:hypothetical protein
MGCRLALLRGGSIDVIWAHCHNPSRLEIPAWTYPPDQGTGKLNEALSVHLLLNGVRILITDTPSKQALVCVHIARRELFIKKTVFH